MYRSIMKLEIWVDGGLEPCQRNVDVSIEEKDDKMTQPYRKDFREFQGDYYWSAPRVFFMGIIGLVLLCSAIFGLNYFGYANFAFFAPKFEAVRRDQMIESRAYTEGTIRELYTLKRQYDTAKTDDERATISAAARHEFSIFPKERLPNDLLAFMIQIGG